MRVCLLALGWGLSLTLAACASPDDDDDDGGSDDDLILDVRANCDTTASVWDDLFTWEVETVSEVEKALVEVYVGSDSEGRILLSERGTGNWYGEEWADELDADCDDWRSMYFEIYAESAYDSETVTINP